MNFAVFGLNVSDHVDLKHVAILLVLVVTYTEPGCRNDLVFQGGSVRTARAGADSKRCSEVEEHLPAKAS